MQPTIERRRSSQYSSLTGSAPTTFTPTGGGDYAYVFSGRCFLWDQPSDDIGGFVEIMRHGCFSKAIQSPNIRALLDHESKVLNILGTTGAGTLALVEDEQGLAFIIHSPNTSAARDAAEIIRSNPVGVSFAFAVVRDRKTVQPDGRRLREILEVSVIEEISFVVDAAYKSSSVSVIEMGNRSAPRQSAMTIRRPSVEYLERELRQFAAEHGDFSILR